MHGKRYKETVKLIDKKKIYSIEEAVSLLKQTAKAKFDETVELHARLGIDPKKGEEQVRGMVALPTGSGKTKRITAFVTETDEKAAQEAGADKVGGEELISQIAQSGKVDFDIAVATPGIMPKLAKIAKILGPKGLMPNPKTETVGADVKKMITELKRGKVAFKNDDGGNVHLGLGKISFAPEALTANIRAFMDVLTHAKPATSKGQFIREVYLTTTMGPSVRIG